MVSMGGGASSESKHKWGRVGLIWGFSFSNFSVQTSERENSFIFCFLIEVMRGSEQVQTTYFPRA